MSVTVELPAEALRRLEAEATRRGVSIDDVIAELAARLPAEAPSTVRRLSFIGIGASGDTRPLDIHRERAEMAGVTTIATLNRRDFAVVRPVHCDALDLIP